MGERSESVLTRYDELEIENRALRAEVKRLNRDMQAAFDDAHRAASEHRQRDRERVVELERDFETLLEWVYSLPTTT